MTEAKKYLAFDLGAESGRAIVGSLAGGRMSLDILHRFPNGPVNINGSLLWDVLGIFRNLKQGVSAYSAKYGTKIDAAGVDSWGVDFGLLDKKGMLLGTPYHYRDSRTDGIPEKLFEVVSKKTVYERTGIQILPFNTLYQLYSMVKAGEPILELADKMLCIADLQNYFFTGEKVAEFSLATTTQMYDPRASDWAEDMLAELGIPAGILPDVVAPGSIVGNISEHVAAECGVKSCPMIAPGCHDTASAVAACPGEGDDWMYLSSGTWSLLGVELTEPLINAKTEKYNFTNEGGVDGTYRFLKNIAGLWLVQECRREWERQGVTLDYTQITQMAADAKPFKSVVDPASDEFLAPGNMPGRIAEYCSRTGQDVPQDKGEFVRTALESLALSYRRTIETIEEITGRTYNTLNIVGGGTQNRLLNQFAADATGKVVKTGPVEATAFGNCLMQAIAIGDIGSLAEAREIVRNSVEIETYEPSSNRQQWDDAYAKFLKIGG